MKRITVLLFITLFFYSHINAQWQQTNGPYGRNINCMAVSGSNIFAGTDHGSLYLSSDNGANWMLKNLGLSPYSKINALAISGNNIIAGEDRWPAFDSD